MILTFRRLCLNLLICLYLLMRQLILFLLVHLFLLQLARASEQRERYARRASVRPSAQGAGLATRAQRKLGSEPYGLLAQSPYGGQSCVHNASVTPFGLARSQRFASGQGPSASLGSLIQRASASARRARNYAHNVSRCSHISCETSLRNAMHKT